MDASAGQAVTETEDRENAEEAPTTLRAEQPAPERLVLARGIFCGPAPKISDDLYAPAKGKVTRERQTLRLEKGASVNTNTYFGRFAAAYWQRWTKVTEVEVGMTLEATGKVRIRLAASDIAGHRRVVDTAVVKETGRVVLRAPLDMYIDGGALWLEIEALGGEAVITDLEWTAAAPEQVRPVAIAICTFNRAPDRTEMFSL
ncbi:hypothetical protein ACFWWS_37555 [Streptomyces sp. NPDC059083]|uniref:hypothetical protein n=1 Tax=Streptomyces sp. NPDC059083 TaxID=3346721 RepID=UPI0036A5EAA7